MLHKTQLLRLLTNVSRNTNAVIAGLRSSQEISLPILYKAIQKQELHNLPETNVTSVYNKMTSCKLKINKNEKSIFKLK